MKLFNYFLLIICVIFKGFDVLITDLVIKDGGVELNPMGFNLFTITMGFILLIPLFFVNLLSKDRIILLIVGASSIINLGMVGFVINMGVVLL